MPRQISEDDDKPRRPRRAKAVAIEADAARGLVVRVLLYSPKDTIACMLAFAAIGAILANALLLQAGRHPAPMFGPVIAIPLAPSAPASPMPRPRPVEASPASPEQTAADPKSADPLTSLVKATNAAPVGASNVARVPAPVPAPSRSDPVAGPGSGNRRVAAVQRALTEYGYGQLKPTGIAGSDTQTAIQNFERLRKLPVTGQVSDRLLRELSAMIGHPID